MKNLITIGLPSKGRLKDKSVAFFDDKGLKVLQSKKERNYFATIENKPNIKIIKTPVVKHFGGFLCLHYRYTLDEQFSDNVDKQMLIQLVNENVIAFNPMNLKKAAILQPFFLQ